MRNYLNYIKIFSPKCYACNKQALPKNNKSIFCPNCWSILQNSWIETPHPFYNIPRLKMDLIQNHWVAFQFYDKGILQKLLHRLKYENNKDLAFKMGGILGKRISAPPLNAILVPIPLHLKKLRSRGYNQAEIIAQGIAKTTGLTVNNKILIRKSYSDTQTKKNKSERQENTANSFEFLETKADQHYILVDDLVTTGATLEACIDSIQQKVPNALISIACLGINDLK